METRDYAMLADALADETRLGILFFLKKNGSSGSGTIKEKFSLAPSTVSFHLSALVKAGFILYHKKGRSIYYSLNEPLFERLSYVLYPERERHDRR